MRTPMHRRIGVLLGLTVLTGLWMAGCPSRDVRLRNDSGETIHILTPDESPDRRTNRLAPGASRLVQLDAGRTTFRAVSEGLLFDILDCTVPEPNGPLLTVSYTGTLNCVTGN